MIVVFGSINLDLVIAVPALPLPGETVLGEGYRLLPGGKGANQALAAARDGARVVLAGAVGRDAFAAAALPLLRAAGVDLTRLAVVDRPTGCAAVTVASSGENMIAVAPGANAALSAAAVADDLLGPGTTLLAQLEVPLAEVEALLRRARARRARILLNLAPALPLAPDLLRLIDVLVANEGEAAALPLPPADAARSLGVAVVVTRGARGAVAYPPGAEPVAVPALPVAPVDTTGAGDAFVGVLAAALDAGRPLDAALRRAAAAGSLACLAAGAQPSLPDAAAIDRALAAARG